MGLAVYLAVVIGDHALGGDILSFGITAEVALLDDGEPLLVKLGKHFGLEVVPLQCGGVRVPGSETKLTVAAAIHGLGVVGGIGGFIGDLIIQVFHETGGAIIKIVNILAKTVTGDTAVGVKAAARITPGFRPMIPGVISICTRRSVKDGAG